MNPTRATSNPTPTPTSILAIPGITLRSAAKLDAHGIRTRADLVPLGDDPHACARLATRAGLTTAELRRLAQRARLLGLPGMTPDHLRTLMEAGITAMSELAAISSRELRERVAHLGTGRAPDCVPTQLMLLGWIATARMQSAPAAA